MALRKSGEHEKEKEEARDIHIILHQMTSSYKDINSETTLSLNGY
jgi:hypothetical protein